NAALSWRKSTRFSSLVRCQRTWSANHSCGTAWRSSPTPRPRARDSVQLTRLALTNFRQHERTDLTLGAGLLAVVGPNGAGKSTLLEAIAWALYGTAAARGSRDSIKRRGSPARSRV